MNFKMFIGMMAGTLATIAFLPQVIKVIKTKSTKDISLLMFIVFSAGVFLWLVYGILNHDLALIIANIITLILSVIILGYKLKYK